MPDYDPNNVFAKILSGDLPSHKVYEDDRAMAFMDVMPRSDGHVLVIPKKPARNILDVQPEELGYVIGVVQTIAKAVKKAMGADGLTDATSVAVLAANYVAARLGDAFPVLYAGDHGLVAHECILDLREITKTAGLSIDDVANPTARTFRAFAEKTGSDLKALAACIRGSRDPITREMVAQIACPVLVATGTEDVIGGQAEELAALIPGAEALPIPRRDHMLAVGDRVYKEGALAFLRRRA